MAIVLNSLSQASEELQSVIKDIVALHRTDILKIEVWPSFSRDHIELGVVYKIADKSEIEMGGHRRLIGQRIRNLLLIPDKPPSRVCALQQRQLMRRAEQQRELKAIRK